MPDQFAYGRRAPKNAPALRAAAYFLLDSAGIPAHPMAVDYLARLTGWAMLGNDRAGDCVGVTWANFRRLMTAVLGAREVYPTLEQCIALYKTQNPNFDINGTADTNGPGSAADGGMDIQTVLEYLVSTGGPDGVKALGFAKVDHTNLDEVKAAIAIFGAVWIGVNVLAVNQTEFANGQPWDYVPGSANDGGHSILGGGYTGQPGNDVRFITWAAETGFTDAFWTHQVEECWVVIWPEHMGSKEFTENMDLATFASDYQAITGRPFPVAVPTPAPAPVPVPPAPAPAPVPVPTPGPVPPVDADEADRSLLLVVRKWAGYHHFGPESHTLAKALRTWMLAKGFGSAELETFWASITEQERAYVEPKRDSASV